MTPRQHLRFSWRRLKRLAEFVFFTSFDHWALLGVTAQSSGKTALIHVELLGDLFIWMPSALHISREVGAERLVIICNAGFEDVAKHFLPGTSIFPIAPRRFMRDLRYRWETLRKLRQLGCERAAAFSIPRDGTVADATMRALGARSTFGHADTYADRAGVDRWLTAGIFDELLPSLGGIHRSQQHARLIRAMGIDGSTILPNVPPVPSPEFLPSSPYFVVSPGASSLKKAWPLTRFQDLCKMLLERFPQLHCVIAGSLHEAPALSRMAEELGPRAICMAGRNTLIELDGAIARACCVISNDSAAAHIAAFRAVPALVVMNGATMGHCHPYPQNGLYPVPPKLVFRHMPCFGCDWNCRYPMFKGQALPCLQEIQVNDVAEDAIDLIHRADCASVVALPTMP